MTRYESHRTDETMIGLQRTIVWSAILSIGQPEGEIIPASFTVHIVS